MSRFVLFAGAQHRNLIGEFNCVMSSSIESCALPVPTIVHFMGNLDA